MCPCACASSSCPTCRRACVRINVCVVIRRVSGQCVGNRGDPGAPGDPAGLHPGGVPQEEVTAALPVCQEEQQHVEAQVTLLAALRVPPIRLASSTAWFDSSAPALAKENPRKVGPLTSLVHLGDHLSRTEDVNGPTFLRHNSFVKKGVDGADFMLEPYSNVPT